VNSVKHWKIPIKYGVKMPTSAPTERKTMSSYDEDLPERRKRGAFDIMSDIIANIPPDGIRKTQLAYRSLLDYRVFERYLEIMVKDGLVTYDDKTGKIYATEQGRRFHEQWKALKEIVKKTKIQVK
jgi:predicted transcriptional regulator